jgi:hypothetical protein
VAGDVVLRADVEGVLIATATGVISAVAEDSDQGGLGVNALIASNAVTGHADVRVVDAALTVGGDFSAGANQRGEIEATNTAGVSASGTAIGATLAFNTLGWADQNVGAAAIDALLGTGLGQQVPLRTEVEVARGGLQVSGDVSIEALQVPQITAQITNTAASEAGAGMGFVLATNRIARDVNVKLTPNQTYSDDGLLVTVAGDFNVLASDTSGIAASVDLTASGATAAVGGLVARNDIQGDVAIVFDGLRVAVDGSVSLLARAAATITSELTGEVTSSSDEGDGGFAAGGLVATNTVLGGALISLAEAELRSGGD